MSRTQSILWTGGWDSTFHVVRSLICGTSEIQPVYLIDESRASTAMELLTMKRIKQKIRTDFPARAGALLPVRFVAVSDLMPDDAFTGVFSAVRKRNPLGVQYDWLGRFCRQFGVSNLELCIHQDDWAHRVLQGIVERPGETFQDCRVGERYIGTDEYELFQYYSFPIFDLTKRDMQSIAEELGFSAIMKLTWFCHTPKDGKPCGSCGPCRFTVEEGLGWRVPYFRRLKGAVVWNLRLARERAKAIPLWQARST